MRKRKAVARRLLWGSGILAVAITGIGGATVSGESVERAPAAAEAGPNDPGAAPADDRSGYVGVADEGDATGAAVDEAGSKPDDPTMQAEATPTGVDVPGEVAASGTDDDGVTSADLVSAAEAKGNTAGSLRAALEGKRRIRVIVTMALDTELEAELSAGQVRAQRAAIDETQADLAGVLDGTGSRIVSRFQMTPAAVALVDEDGLDALLADPAVAAVTLDRELEPALDTSTGVIDSDLLNTAGVLGNNFDGSSGGAFEVAVLDTGVDNTHDAFAGRIVAQACFSTGPWCPNGLDQQIGGNAGDDCTYSTQCDHGTHVGGIASGAVYTNGHEGVARGSRLVAIQIGHRVTGAGCGTGPDPCWRTFFSDMDQALQHVLNRKIGGANVAAVNLSIGGGGPSNNCDATLPNSQNLMTQLRAQNVAVVVAAGNDGFNTGVSQPGCLTSAFTISATDNNDVPAGFTNSGTKTTWWAPGVGIVAPVPSAVAPHDNEGSKSGTSMSTPHVAGAFALLKECVDGNGVPRTINSIAGLLNNSGVDVTRNGVTRRRINVLDAATATVNNNDFASPETLPANPGAGFNDFDFTVCSDAEPGEPGPFSVDNGIWYSWTPSATGTATISTNDGGGNVTTFDTTLAVYTGASLGALEVVAFDDDSGTGLRSLVNFPVNGGTTYRIKVDGFAAANGLLNLHLENGPPPTCFGGPGATLVGTPGNNVLNGTPGNDVIVALGGDDTIRTFGGNDRVCGDAGDDDIETGDGDDFVLGGPGADRIKGNSGDDSLVGNSGGGNNDDVGDTIIGSQGDDFLDGWVGDDTLIGNEDNDSINGAAGIDTALYGTANSGVTASLVTNTATGDGNDTFSGVENLGGSPFADTFRGDGVANVLRGENGADDIRGGAQADLVVGGGGNDELRGDNGNDTVRGIAGNDTVDGDDGADFVGGDDGNDTVNGDDGADTGRGGRGDDEVRGGAGPDSLFGDRGNDFLHGASGNDTCNGGPNADTASPTCEVTISIP